MEKKGFRSFGFTELRNIAVPEEMGRIEQSKYDGDHMEASGEQTKKFLYKLKRFLNTKAELLKRQETQLHFTKAPENEQQIYERFVGISSIIRQKDGSMYIFFFHAHHDVADSLLKYIIYDLYESSSNKWVLNAKEASEWWEIKGFTQDNNYTIMINKEK